MAAIKVSALWISIIIFVRYRKGEGGRGEWLEWNESRGSEPVIRLTTYI